MRVEGDALVFTVALDPASTAAVETEIEAFGYRSDKPFGEMPKIRVDAKGLSHDVYDKRQDLPADSVQVSRQPGQIEVRIPLALLGNPERMFLSAEAKSGDKSLAPLPWVALDLRAAR